MNSAVFIMFIIESSMRFRYAQFYGAFLSPDQLS